MQNEDLSNRLEKVEESLDSLKESQYKYHLELLDRIQGMHNVYTGEINEVKRTLEKHGSYWAMLVSSFSLVGAGVIAWIQGFFTKH